MKDLVLYGTPLSPFVRKIEAVLHHVGAECDFESINIMKMPDWFVEISPARRIPVLRDRTISTEGIPGTIADSSAIAIFLDRKFGSDLFGDDAYAAGRIAWFEEYSDFNLARTVGLDIFRPIIFQAFGGNPPDLETARKGWNEKLPPIFDYLEGSLAGAAYLVGDKLSLADFAVAAQMLQLDLVAGLPDAGKWPALVKHTEAMKALPNFAGNLAQSAAMLKRVLPEKVALA